MQIVYTSDALNRNKKWNTVASAVRKLKKKYPKGTIEKEIAVGVVVRDKKNDTSNDFSIVVGETESTFSFNFKVENIKILPGTYDVVVSRNLLSRFTCRDYDLKYYIALEH